MEREKETQVDASKFLKRWSKRTQSIQASAFLTVGYYFLFSSPLLPDLL